MIRFLTVLVCLGAILPAGDVAASLWACADMAGGEAECCVVDRSRQGVVKEAVGEHCCAVRSPEAPSDTVAVVPVTYSADQALTGLSDSRPVETAPETARTAVVHAPLFADLSSPPLFKTLNSYLI